MLRVIVRCLVISILVAVPAAAAFAAGIVELPELMAANAYAAALAVGVVVLLSAFTGSLIASWWNTGAVVSSEVGPDTGEVKWFNVSKGFGFITMDSGGDVFVHFRDIRGKGHRSLAAGQRVAFNVKQTDKGPQAHEVSIVSQA